jgi:hypothetical protein
MESAPNATTRRASRSSEFDGGRPTLHLASSRRLAIETVTAAAIGDATTIAAMPSMTINTATSFKPPAGGSTAAGLGGSAAVAPVPAGSQEAPVKTRRELIGKRRKGGHYHREALQAQGAVTTSAPVPGSASPLLVKANGTIMQGNTRIWILMQRGYDVDSLPRVPYESPSLPFEEFPDF